MSQARITLHAVCHGSGKTSVIGPLLVLFLADGDQLVTQVVPAALLQMSREMMWRRFGAVVSKRIFTFTFERSTGVADPSDLTTLIKKLQIARDARGVMVAAPASLKSLMLKFIEAVSATAATSDGGDSSAAEK